MTRNRAIIMRVRGGEKYDSIALDLGISRQRVEQIVRQAGVRSRRSHKDEGMRAAVAARRARAAAEKERWAAEKEERAARAAAAVGAVRGGRPVYEVSAEFRIPYNTLEYHLMQAGACRGRGVGAGPRGYTEGQKDAVRAALGRGMGCNEVAWATGVAYPTVRKLAERLRAGEDGQDAGPKPGGRAAAKP